VTVGAAGATLTVIHARPLGNRNSAHDVLREPSTDRPFRRSEAVPKWIQPLTLLNPIAHFAALTRSVLGKGAGLDVVSPPDRAVVLPRLLVAVSAGRFRRHLV
jgi:hypothetical protein